MNCKQAQFLMALFIANDPDLTVQQHTEFQAHLKSCPECAREYEESKIAIELAKQYWPINDETAVLIEKAGRNYKPKMTVEEGWKDLCRRCPDLAASTERPKSLQLFLRIGAVAACLVIGILTWMVFSNYSKPQTLPQDSSSQQVASVLEPSVKVELVTNTGNIPIPSDQQITSTSQSKTLLINGKHQMMMNTNTVLTIEPLAKYSNIGCLVKLDSGQIYTHVQHDGNPFAVETACGKAIITGTTFDIKATDTGTTLVVTEGTVQFESENGVVNVAAGQKSEIIGQSAPSIPLSSNTADLTAWATGYKPGPASAQAGSNDNDWYLALSLRKEPIVLEETEYANWVEQKRDWFKQEFPWIFKLKDALVKEGIEVDYPELLIKTGDVWQFICLETTPVRFSVVDPNSLLKAASDYGFDKQWLLENVPAAKYAMASTASVNNFTGLKAFERWLKYLDETNELEPPTPLYSFHTSKYLENTRSLIWFAVRDGQYDLTDEDRIDVLALLQKEVTVACMCQNAVLYPEKLLKQSCDKDKYQNEIEIVSAIYEYEKTLDMYIPVSLTLK